MNSLRREDRGIVINADAHPALVLRHIINPIRDGLAELFVQKVVNLYLIRFALGAPLPPAILEIFDDLLLFRVH